MQIIAACHHHLFMRGAFYLLAALPAPPKCSFLRCVTVLREMSDSRSDKETEKTQKPLPSPEESSLKALNYGSLWLGKFVINLSAVDIF